MKKLIYAFGALALIFSSCSSDDSSDNSNNNDNYLLKKEIVTDEDGFKTTYNFKYNGNKLISAIDDDSESLDTYFTYTGDLITKVEWKLNGTVEQTDLYEYDSAGKLLTYIRLDNEMKLGSKEVYDYNIDGTILCSHYSGDLESQDNFDGRSKIYFTNGEVTKIERLIDDKLVYLTRTYTHDNKNGVQKNVTGLAKIAFVDSDYYSVNHNTISSTDTDLGNTSAVYTYNSANYPIKVIETDTEGTKSTSEFFY